MGDPSVCRECYGLGGRDVHGGPGACERCGREGEGETQKAKPLRYSASATFDDGVFSLTEKGWKKISPAPVKPIFDYRAVMGFWF